MKKVKLGEVCEIRIGKTPNRSQTLYWGGDYPWLSISDMKGKILCTTKEKITQEAVQKEKMQIVSKGTVVMSFKLSIGKVGILDENMYTNEAIANFVVKNNKMLFNEYLYYALQGMNFDSLTDRAVMGKTLNKAKLNNLSIVYNEPFMQQQIVLRLDGVNKLIESRKQQLSELSKLVKSRFNELFGDIFDNPQSKLEDHIELNPNKKELLNFNGNVSFLPMSNVSENGKIDLSINRNIDDVRKGFTFFKDNDVIVAKITPCFENGKGAPVFGLLNGVGFGSTEFHVLRPKNTVNTVWLYHVTMLSKFRVEGERKMTGSGGQRRITKDFINNFKLNIPPLALQNEFAEFVAQVDKSQLAIQKSLEELETLKKSLMQEYFG